MAKTYSNLYPSIYSFDSLQAAHIAARRGRLGQAVVQDFERDLDGGLIQLQNELIWGMYRVGCNHQFRDRVLQQSLLSVIAPIWERRFIHDSYAGRSGKGLHRYVARAETMMRKVHGRYGGAFVLQAGILNLFDSIDHGIMKTLIRRRIRCNRTLVLIDRIFDSMASPGSLCPAGLPIESPISRLLANVYLHELDDFVKQSLRERFYVRYMGGLLVVHHDKSHLCRVRAQVERFLEDNLRLQVNVRVLPFAERAYHHE